MSSEKFCLRWNDFESNISVAFRELREDKDFFDVTLACDDQQMQAHKVILSACSPFFRSVLKKNPHAHPLLYLKGVKYVDLVAVLNFMYHGEVNVAQEELNSFLAVAEELKVKGLTQNGPPSPGRREPVTAPKRQIVTDPVPPPPPKRPRPPPPIASPADEEEIQEVLPSVKAEPREAQYQPQEQEQVDHHQSLAQVDEYGGEEGYEEDYGQYEEGYAMMATAGGAEGNKGKPFLHPIFNLSISEVARLATRVHLDIWCHESYFSGTYRESRGPLQIPVKTRYWRFLMHPLHEVLRLQKGWQEPLGGNPLP